MTTSSHELLPNHLGHPHDFTSISSKHVPEYAWIRGIGLQKRDHQVYYSPTDQSEGVPLPEGRGYLAQVRGGGGCTVVSRSIAPPTLPQVENSSITLNDTLLVPEHQINLDWSRQNEYSESISISLPEVSPGFHSRASNNAAGHRASPESLLVETSSSSLSGSAQINNSYPNTPLYQHKEESSPARIHEPTRSTPDTITLSDLIQSWTTAKGATDNTEQENLARQERVQTRRNYANRMGHHRILTARARSEDPFNYVRNVQHDLIQRQNLVRLLGVKLGVISDEEPVPQQKLSFCHVLPQVGRNQYMNLNGYIFRLPWVEWVAMTHVQSHGEITTLRHVIFKGLFLQRPAIPSVGEATNRVHAPRPSRHETRRVSLDEPLSELEVHRLTEALPEINQSYLNGSLIVRLALCAVCKLPRLLGSHLPPRLSLSEILEQHGTRCVISEFNLELGIGDCCSSLICNTCIAEDMLQSIYERWWHELGTRLDRSWLCCPACKITLSGYYNSSFAVDETLRVLLGDELARPHINAFSRAQELRIALKALRPVPTYTELARSWRLHTFLINNGNMKSFWDGLGIQGSPTAAPIQVQVVSADFIERRTNNNIPIFTHLFQRWDLDCIVCTETYREIAPIPGSTPTATRSDLQLITRLPSNFPTPWQLSECRHEHVVCRTCFSTHITTEVESRSRACINSIKCPHPDCSHVLTYEELRHLAPPGTFEAYDHHLALSLISGLPEFRWCLRPGCSAGSLYKIELSQSIPNMIACNECGFHMCYHHQVPWHLGLTCSEFDSLSEHGDPQYAETQRWLGDNTKACPGPGCGVPIVKGPGCFHMTCSVSTCKHEFCWECLADWSGIFHRGVYSIEGHNEGCYFRSAAVMPTQVAGQNLRAALGIS